MIKKISNSVTTQATVQANIHYYFAVDVSGSMHYELPKLRDDLKNSLATTLQQGDHFSLLYYSSNGDSGFILKDYVFDGIDSLKAAQRAIDNLKSRYLTGFKEPLQTLIQSIENDTMPAVVVFMSDGYENQNSKSVVINLCEALGDKIADGVVVEYGDWANHELLCEMAERLGSFSYASGSNSYATTVDKVLQGSYGTKYIEIENTSQDMVFSYSNGMPKLYSLNNGVYKIPEGTDYYELRIDEKGKFNVSDDVAVLCCAYLLQMQSKAKLCYELLGAYGDVELIDVYDSAIGKQRINAFMQRLLDNIENEKLRFAKGRDYNYMPDANQYCLFNFFNDFSARENYIFTLHEGFVYNRIGQRRVQASSILSDEDRERLSSAVEVSELNKIAASKYKLSYEPLSKTQGHRLDLVMNTTSANISFRVSYPVSVDLSVVPNHRGPSSITTRVTKNYAIIKDMVLNIKKLVVSLDEKTKNLFEGHGLIEKRYEDGKYLLDLSVIPVVNRSMITNFDEQAFVAMNYEYLLMKYEMRVLNDLKKTHCDVKDEQLSETYNDEYLEYLESIGIGRNGFSPKMVAVSGADEYVANKNEVKFDKIGTIPSIKSVVDKLASGKKLTDRETMLLYFIDEYQIEGIEPSELELAILHWHKTANYVKQGIENEISKSLIAALVSKHQFSESFSFVNTNVVGPSTISGKIDAKEVVVPL